MPREDGPMPFLTRFLQSPSVWHPSLPIMYGAWVVADQSQQQQQQQQSRERRNSGPSPIHVSFVFVGGVQLNHNFYHKKYLAFCNHKVNGTPRRYFASQTHLKCTLNTFFVFVVVLKYRFER